MTHPKARPLTRRPYWQVGLTPRVLGLLVAAMTGSSTYGATIYLCRNYGGGEFWSNAHCSRQSALIVRLTTVPDGMPFDQQVNLAQAAKAEGERLAAPAQQQAPTMPPGSTADVSECAALDARIRSLDAQARQPHNGRVQDQIAASRKAARDRQFALRCR